jgi:hypothetical protein
MLPRMKMGDWLFWSIITWIFANFFWIRFVEKFVPMWVGAVVATALAVSLFAFGPRLKEEEGEEEE